ncbi:diguanylate cyclase [Pseudomonas oryzae]|uniref:PAS domain S-box-containing protein/diguanylate cyclase (GGDEF) domain-containing protein n=1 Tax=Pseudomonas oryzae TaxID=1392877 RepID=A0A1H1ZB42_9PSED|nr:diguanylate cyclase [Pseudomonas oryzae]SDT30853.1 PAS domain S-box-containing protein/diguanylate cyclase (GGDEF) domain-containing protein [Pseudomonas oryzae]
MQTSAEPDQRHLLAARLAQRHFAVALACVCAVRDGRRHILASAGALPELADTHVLPADEHAWLAARPAIRFHAACPLLAADGSHLGELCLFDTRPRELDEEQRQALRDLAGLAAGALDEARRENALRAEVEALRASEQQMALAIAGSGTGIWDRNIASGEIFYSSGWKALLGYTEDEVGSRIEESYKRIHPDDLAYVRAAMQAHFEGRTASYEVEHRIRCKDGSYKWICSRGKVVGRDAGGRPLRMIGTTTDITAMHALSEHLQQSVDLITNLTNEVPGLVFQYRRLADGAAFFPYVSAGIRDIYELEPQQVAESDAAIHALIHPDDREAYRASLQASAAALSPWELEYRVLLPRQGLRWRQGAARPRALADGTLWHGFITDVTERKRIEAELHEFATTDFLTQLPNRRHFMSQIEAELARQRRSHGQSAAVLMCDLDHFKAINDQWGHAVGDLVLRHFAAILRAQLRKSDVAGRVGGEEFAVLLPETSLEQAGAFARRLQHCLAELPLLQDARAIVLTISVGIAALGSDDPGVDAALSRSDMALYRAKSAGRNRIELG